MIFIASLVITCPMVMGASIAAPESLAYGAIVISQSLPLSLCYNIAFTKLGSLGGSNMSTGKNGG